MSAMLKQKAGRGKVPQPPSGGSVTPPSSSAPLPPPSRRYSPCLPAWPRKGFSRPPTWPRGTVSEHRIAIGCLIESPPCAFAPLAAGDRLQGDVRQEGEQGPPPDLAHHWAMASYPEPSVSARLHSMHALTHGARGVARCRTAWIVPTQTRCGRPVRSARCHRTTHAHAAAASIAMPRPGIAGLCHCQRFAVACDHNACRVCTPVCVAALTSELLSACRPLLASALRYPDVPGLLGQTPQSRCAPQASHPLARLSAPHLPHL